MTAVAARNQVGRPTREGDLSLELRGMAPIPDDGRYGSRYRIFTVWFAPNLVPAAFFVGVIAGASFIGLSFAWTIAAIVLGNLIGALSAESHHMAVDYSAYEGLRVTGGVDVVVSRGTVLVEGGELHDAEGHGRFVPRKPFEGLDVPRQGYAGATTLADEKEER
jgi:hypothetical protein